MPSKGRSHPCDDPMKKGHTKKRQYQDVKPVSDVLLRELRDTLPEFNWKEGTRMCGNCRGKAMYQMKLRKAALHLAGGGSGMDDVAQSGDDDGSAAIDISTSSSSRVPSVEPTSSTAAVAGCNIDTTREKTPSSEVPSAPPLSAISDMGLPEPSSTSNIATPSGSPDRNAPVTPSADSEFVTPTRPSLRTAIRQGYEAHTQVQSPATPSSSTQSTPTVSSLASPSVIAESTASTESGSVFYDEQTAKHELNQLLQRLGVRGTDKTTKWKPRKLIKLMNDGMAAFRKLFEQYVGGALPDDPTPCTCNHCKLLTAAVKAKLPEMKSRKEKYLLLTSLPLFMTVKMIHEQMGVTTYVARLVSKLRSIGGPFSFPDWKPTGKSLNEKVKQFVIDFYLSNDNSRVNTTARECVFMPNEKGEKEKVAKRTMMANLKDSFLEFKNTHPDVEIGVSKFAELRPKNVKWPGQKGVHISCTCIIHENFKLMLQGLRNSSIDALKEEFETDPTAAFKLQLMENYKELIKYLICDPPTEECYLGYCEICPNEVNREEIFMYSFGNTITYNYWEKNDITTRLEEQGVFEENFLANFLKFLTHEYIYQEQKEFIQTLKTGSMNSGTSCVLTVDYGENYSFVVQNAVQGYHWNNKQATIHPFCLYVPDAEGNSQYKTYFVISDDLCHDATAFHTFRHQVIKRIKEEYPHIRNIDYVSDGAGSQYKNRFNIANLLYHENDFNLTARWIFTATSHGKSTCDALSAVVKRVVRIRSLSSDDPITTPLRMFEVAQNELTSEKLEFIYVTHDDVEHYRGTLQQRYSQLRTIPGTQQFHFLAVENKKLLTKRYANSTNFQLLDVIEPEECPEEMETDIDDPAPLIKPRIGEFYAIMFGNTYQVGQAIEADFEAKTVRFMMMKKMQGGIALNWPLTETFQDTDFSKIVLKVSAPYFYEPKKNYRLTKEDHEAVRIAIAQVQH